MKLLIPINLQVKVIFTALTLAVAPLIILVFLNNRSVTENLTDVANQTLTIAAEQTASRIDQLLLENLLEIQAAGQLSPFSQYLKLRPENRPGSNEEILVSTILRTLSRKVFFMSTPYAILDADGINVLDTQSWRMGRDESQEIYFREPLKTGTPYISPVLFSSEVTRQAFFYVSGPIFNVAGEVVGVLRIQLSIAFLQDMIANTSGLAGPDSFGLLMDQNHFILAHSNNQEMIFKTIGRLDESLVRQLQSAGQLPKISQNNLVIDVPSLEEKLQSSSSSSTFITSLTPGSNQPVQAASAALEQTNWLVVVAQPRDAFLKPIGKQIKSTLWLVLVIGIVVMVIAIVVAHQLSQPIINMTDIARKIAIGDLTVRVPITSRDELGQLAQSFNDMAGQLQELIGSLQKSEEKYRRLTENAQDMIYRMSLPEGHYEYVNPASLDLFGYTPDDFYRSPILIKELIHPDWRNYFREQWARLINGEAPSSYEYQIIHKSGEVKWLYQRNLLICNENGLPIALEAIVTDITERRKVEDEIRRLNVELEQRVLERTAQLEASNKELEAFSYSVSHDLRAPLRHISGYVDLLNNRFREALPDKAKHYLETITASSNQMGTLIDDLLQFSRTGRQEMRQGGMDMNVLLKEVLEMLKNDIHNRNISWNIAELPKVFGDYSLLKQVWVNLLDNALKFTRNNDAAEIEVGFSQESDQWVFFVRDNGVGFDTQYAKKLFGVFQRLHSQTDFEGTGIGLANVQRIVHKHAGRVWAESQLGKGATFYFTIPYRPHNEGDIR